MPEVPQCIRRGLVYVALLSWLLPLSAPGHERASGDSHEHSEQRLVSEATLAAALTLRIAKFIKWPERPT
ncbi:MAG: hypothetical protein HKN85_06880, partial [Gammaproteobacteria bacterium]|nr:hypothetical protein [Gammaproteobacteria bacterium]